MKKNIKSVYHYLHDILFTESNYFYSLSDYWIYYFYIISILLLFLYIFLS